MEKFKNLHLKAIIFASKGSHVVISHHLHAELYVNSIYYKYVQMYKMYNVHNLIRHYLMQKSLRVTVKNEAQLSQRDRATL